MIEVTGVHLHEAWHAGVLPNVERVRPGLWSIPVPIPDNPLRYVLVYCLELDDGVALVDAGWNDDDAWHALNVGLADAGGSVSDVRAVLVTHLHPDHHGLAGRVRDASGAWVGLHQADAELLRSRASVAEGMLAARHDMPRGRPAGALLSEPSPAAVTEVELPWELRELEMLARDRLSRVVSC